MWGGYFPSQHADTVLRDGCVDVCVRGQGEITFAQLAQTLTGGGSLAGVAGISYRAGDGDVHHNPDRPLTELEELPDWPYRRLPMERYFHRHYLGDRVATHQTSYGCPFGCSFCAIVGIAKRRWVAQSPARVARILADHQRHQGADAVQFHDMDFFVSEDRVVEIAERIRPLSMTWWGLGRVDELMRYSDRTWSTMRSSGLKMAFCGAESGSDEVLARMNKGGRVSCSMTLDLVKRMAEWNVVPELSFVIGNPPDPREDIDHTLEFVRQIKRLNPATEIILYMYTPVPLEGMLFEEARRQGFRFPETLDGWVSGDWRTFSMRRDPPNPWLAPDLQRRVRNFDRVLNAYYPTSTDLSIRGLKRGALRALGGWRYHTRFYSLPLELKAAQRLLRYQRPETAGF